MGGGGGWAAPTRRAPGVGLAGGHAPGARESSVRLDQREDGMRTGAPWCRADKGCRIRGGEPTQPGPVSNGYMEIAALYIQHVLTGAK